MREWEKFEDTRGIVRSRKLKDRQHNGQKKKTKDKHDVMLAILFRSFSFIAPKNFKLFCFPIFRFWAYLMKIIPETRRRAH
jgi:hypothetical protein